MFIIKNTKIFSFLITVLCLLCTDEFTAANGKRS
jgi:hypothetical protein